MGKYETPELQAISDRLDKRQTAAPSKYDRLRERRKRNKISWSDCVAERLQDAIVSVTQDGAALLLSVTSDGGALVARVIDGRKPTPFYAANETELRDLLDDLVSTATEA